MRAKTILVAFTVALMAVSGYSNKAELLSCPPPRQLRRLPKHR
jgi:hypothetical protein